MLGKGGAICYWSLFNFKQKWSKYQPYWCQGLVAGSPVDHHLYKRKMKNENGSGHQETLSNSITSKENPEGTFLPFIVCVSMTLHFWKLKKILNVDQNKNISF